MEERELFIEAHEKSLISAAERAERPIETGTNRPGRKKAGTTP